MFKNTTRRGLAIGAAIAIAFSGLVTSPAQAAGEVVLAPSAGTAYNTFVTENFTLQASLAPGQNSAQAQQLKYKIDKAAGATVSYGVSTSASVTNNASGTLNAASTSVVVAADGAGALTQNFVKLAVTGATSASSTVDVTVTAFVDANNNSTLDAGEFNTPQTVSFKKYADVATAVAVTTPAELDLTVSGTVALTGINTDQVQSARGVVVVLNGTDLSSVSATTTFARSLAAAISGSHTVSAYAVVNNFKVGANATTATVPANTVKAITGSAVVGDNAINASSGNVSARPNSAFAVQASVKNSTSATAVGVASAAVTAAVTSGATLSSTKTLSLNGTVYTTNASLPTALAVTSDASGNAVVNVVTVGFAAEDTITFVFKSQNLTADNLVVTAKDAAYTVKSTGVNNFRTVATSSAFAIDYTVADQFKVALPAGHRLVVAYDGTTKYVAITAGAAKAEFTSTASATILDVTNSGVEKQNTTTLNWATVSATTASAVAVKSTTVAAKFDTAPTHSATATIARATTSNTAGYLSVVSINGKVNHAGQSVTVTSTGVQFSTAAQDAKAVANTITTLADGAGWWTVSAYVVKAGAATFTYAAGTATASTTVTAAAALGNQGTALTISGVADTILPGKTLVATVKLVDEHGNPVAADDAATESFAVTVTGLGFVGSLPTKLNASGEATVAVLLGSADEGSVVITATYDADGTGTAKAAVTVVKTVLVAPAIASEVNVVVGSFNGRWAVRTENAKGSAVSIKVGGKWFKATATSDNFVISRKSKVGATVLVKVWIAGDLQNEQTITVK